MTNAVTASSIFLQTQSLMASSQSQLNKLSEQLTTGQNGQSVADYGSSASTLLNLQSSAQGEQGYVANNTTIQTYLTAYDATIAQLKSDAITLQKVLGSTQTSSAASLAQLTTTVKGLLTDVTATLNTQVGDRYLYSGSRYNTAPVTDLTKLTPLTAPTASPTIVPQPTAVSGATNNGSGLIRLTVGSTTGLTSGQQLAVTGVKGTTEANGTWTINVIDSTHIDLVASTFTNTYTSGGSAVSALPAYDTQAPGYGTPVGSAYAQQTAVIAQNEPSISYGITSNDPTIQSLIYALQNAQAATASGVTAAQQTAYLSNATNLVADAVNGSATNTAVTGFSGSGGLLAGLTSIEGVVSGANAVHTQTLATLKSQTAAITAIDSASIAEELSAIQTQLQATYKVTASTLNLSLLNYIS